MRIFIVIVGLCLFGGVFGALSEQEKNDLLAAHNYYRSIVSPIATDMLKMQWSTKLESVAQKIANECILKQSSSAIEQDALSVNKYLMTSKYPADYGTAVSRWFSENENYVHESNTCSSGCERYKTMVRSEAAFIGCASNVCDMSRLRGSLLVCTYGPITSDATETPYKTGTSSCESCPTGYECENSLCSITEKATLTHKTVVNALSSLKLQATQNSQNESLPTAAPLPVTPVIEKPKYPDAVKFKVILEKHPLKQPKAGTPLYKALSDYCKEVAIIIHTVNENEYWAVMDRLLPPQSDTITFAPPLGRSITFPTKGTVLGTFGGYKVGVVQTNMGAECRDEIEEALVRFPNAKAIIGVGVAFGAKKYQFCDVLVSKWIEDLSTVKFDTENNIITRGEKLEMRPWLLNIFAKQTDEFAVKENFQCTDANSPPRAPKIAAGILFSASWLVDNLAVKNEMFENAPEAVGGEMEGWVLTSIERRLRNMSPPRNIGVIIIKGLSDYGDGTKSREWQFTAAKAAVDFTYFQLEDAGEGALSYQDGKPVISQSLGVDQEQIEGASDEWK